MKECVIKPGEVVDCKKNQKIVKEVFDYLISCKEIKNDNTYYGTSTSNMGLTKNNVIAYQGIRFTPDKIISYEEFLNRLNGITIVEFNPYII